MNFETHPGYCMWVIQYELLLDCWMILKKSGWVIFIHQKFVIFMVRDKKQEIKYRGNSEKIIMADSNLKEKLVGRGWKDTNACAQVHEIWNKNFLCYHILAESFEVSYLKLSPWPNKLFQVITLVFSRVVNGFEDFFYGLFLELARVRGYNAKKMNFFFFSSSLKL